MKKLYFLSVWLSMAKQSAKRKSRPASKKERNQKEKKETKNK